MNQNELYIQSMAEYVRQLRLHISDIEHSILINKAIQESEEHQMEIESKRLILVIAEFNKWADENGADKMAL